MIEINHSEDEMGEREGCRKTGRRVFIGTTIYVGYGVELGTVFHCLTKVALTAFVVAPPTLELSAPGTPKALPSLRHSDHRVFDRILLAEKPPND